MLEQTVQTQLGQQAVLVVTVEQIPAVEVEVDSKYRLLAEMADPGSLW